MHGSTYNCLSGPDYKITNTVVDLVAKLHVLNAIYTFWCRAYALWLILKSAVTIKFKETAAYISDGCAEVSTLI